MTVETLKEQALIHWKENLELVKKMDWRVWKKWPYESRLCGILRVHVKKYPYINGSVCPFCQHYNFRCVYMESAYSSVVRCPLYDEAYRAEGRCCKEWYDVLESLTEPTTKKAAVAAVKAMIKRIEEIDNG